MKYNCLDQMLAEWQGTAEDALRWLLDKQAIGILAYDDFRARSMAIAHGEYKPKTDDPKLWFSSEQAAIDNIIQVLAPPC